MRRHGKIPSMKPKILTVGHACLDIVHSVPSIPLPNTKVATNEVEIRIGGNAANAAGALCEMGANADLCTVLGSDSHPFTRILVALLKQVQIGTEFCRFDDTQPCPNSTIMVTPDGERAIINWQSDHIKSSVSRPRDIRGYSLVMADSYRLPMVREVFSMAREAAVPTMIDVDGAVSDIGLIPRADHIWFSHEAWRKQRIPIQDLQARFGGVVGITDGDRPITWVGTDGIVRHHSPPTIVARNTLGAGDVFRARLGLGICIGESLTSAIENACEVAAKHVTNQPLDMVIP